MTMQPSDLLQNMVDTFGCRYFAENDARDGAVLNFALRSPFVRLYALNRYPRRVERLKHRFAENERVQLFNWTHPACWSELVKLVPQDQPSVFWMHASENVPRGLQIVGHLRPARRDVLVFEVGGLRGVVDLSERYFSRTHSIHTFGSAGLGLGEGSGFRDANFFALLPRS